MSFDYSRFMEPAYDRDMTILSKFNDELYKITTVNSCRRSGIELPVIERKEKNSVNSCKLENNIQRARSAIEELGLCNNWDWFVTLTISPEKHDRYDLAGYKKKLNYFKKDLKKRLGIEFNYLLVPEMHEDGAWHMHGLIGGLPQERLRPFGLFDEKLPHRIRDKLIKGDQVYDWPDYRQRFGFCDFERVREPERASRYITKYVTKDLSRTVTELGGHLYYASKGLKRKEVIKKGAYVGDIEPAFTGKYSSSTWLRNPSTDEISQIAKDLIVNPKEYLNRQKYLQLLEDCPWA